MNVIIFTHNSLHWGYAAATWYLRIKNYKIAFIAFYTSVTSLALYPELEYLALSDSVYKSWFHGHL